MRVRLKLHPSGTRLSASLAEEAAPLTLGALKSGVFTALPALKDVEAASALILSLDGRTPIEGEDGGNVDVVAGDLIHVLNGALTETTTTTTPTTTTTTTRGSAESDVTSTSSPPTSTSSNSRCRSPIAGVETVSSSTSVRRYDDDDDGKGVNRNNDDDDDDDDDQAFSLGNQYSTLSAEETAKAVSRPPHILCSHYVDGQPLPPTLQRVFGPAKPVSKFERIVLVFHALSLEKGFSLAPPSLSRSLLPLDWNVSSDKVELSYEHPSCPELRFRLAFVNLFQSLVVVSAKTTTTTTDSSKASSSSGSAMDVSGKETSATERVSSDEAITGKFALKEFLTPEALGPNPELIYQNMPTLATAFLDAVLNPLLREAADRIGGPGPPSLYQLPYDVAIKLLELLDAKSLARIGAVSRFFHEISATQHLWRNLFLRDFRAIPMHLVGDWKSEYRDAYLRRKEEQRNHRRRPFVNPTPVFDPFGPLLPPPPPNPFRDPFYPFGGDDPFGGGPFGGGGGGLPGPPPPPGPRFSAVRDPPLPGSLEDFDDDSFGGGFPPGGFHGAELRAPGRARGGGAGFFGGGGGRSSGGRGLFGSRNFF